MKAKTFISQNTFPRKTETNRSIDSHRENITTGFAPLEIGVFSKNWSVNTLLFLSSIVEYSLFTLVYILKFDI